MAAQENHIKVIHYLLDHGANQNLTTEVQTFVCVHIVHNSFLWQTVFVARYLLCNNIDFLSDSSMPFCINFINFMH